MLRNVCRRGAAALAQAAASGAPRGGQAGPSCRAVALTWTSYSRNTFRQLATDAAVKNEKDHPGRFFAGAAVLAAASATARVLVTRTGVFTTFIGIPLAVRRPPNPAERAG